MSLVDSTVVGRLWAVGALLRSRRAAASTAHDTADCTGAKGFWPANGFGAESMPPAVAATIAGAAGTVAVATGSTLATAVADCTTTDSDSVVTFVGAGAAGRSSPSVGETRRAAADSGVDTFVAGLDLLAGADAAAAVSSVPLRDPADAEVVVPPAEPEDAVRPPRPRPDERGACMPVDEALFAESAPDEVESSGVAHADAAPLAVIATPMPNATAKPPTRPTHADARILETPLVDGKETRCALSEEHSQNATRSDYRMLAQTSQPEQSSHTIWGWRTLVPPIRGLLTFGLRCRSARMPH